MEREAPRQAGLAEELFWRKACDGCLQAALAAGKQYLDTFAKRAEWRAELRQQ